MLYQYECPVCGLEIELPFKMGEAVDTIECHECGGVAKRAYNTFAIGMDGGLNRTSTFGESIRQRNVKAGNRMKGKKPGLVPVAHDYGNGDVREIKK